MSEPFIAEIRIFAGNFAPRDWAFCDGQLISISQNTALFSLLGTTFGGDGRTTFALPDMRGRAPMHPGHGPGLTDRRLGEVGGVEQVSLTETQMPSHTHQLRASSETTDRASPTGRTWGEGQQVYAVPNHAAPMHAGMTVPNGGGQPHNNLHPCLALNFIIALLGLYPPRS